MGQRRLARVRYRREELDTEESAGDEEDKRGGIAARLNNLTIETAGTEEEAAEGLAVVLEMQVEEDERREGEEGGGRTQRALEALEFLTQEAEPSGNTLVDDHNGFNKLSRSAMLWTVRHRWPAGTRFAFNCYKHWAQLLLCQPGELPVTILSREGVAQGEPISMVLYGITLVSLAEELRAADPGLLSSFYADDAALERSARRSAQLLKLLMKRGLDRGYLPEPAKSLFILNTRGRRRQRSRNLQKKGLC